MKKPFIRQRAFSTPSLGREIPTDSSKDAGLGLEYLNRVACFETLRIYRGQIFLWREHWKRLCESCASIARPLLVSEYELKKWLDRLIQESRFRGAILRLSVHWKAEQAGVFLVILREFEGYPRALYEKGVSVETAVPRRSTPRAWDPQIKASQFVSGVWAMLDNADARFHDFHELIFLNQNQALAEGTVSNIFIVKQKRLLTPSAGSGILRGVTRNFVLSLAQKRGLEISETLLSRHDVYNAEECFLTNTSSEVLPVVRFDRRKIGEGKPGRATKILMKDFKIYAEG